MRGNTTKQEPLFDVVKDIESRFGQGAIRKGIAPVGLPPILTGFSELDTIIGGLPRGHITAIEGKPTSGATTLALSAMAHAGVAVLIDPTYEFDPAYVLRCGVGQGDLLLAHADALTDLIPVAGLIVTRILDQPQRIVPTLAKSTCALVVLTTTSHASLHLRVNRDQWLYADGDVVGFRSWVRVAHNRLGTAGQEVAITIEGL